MLRERGSSRRRHDGSDLSTCSRRTRCSIWPRSSGRSRRRCRAAVARVTLFGSRARGDAEEDSDYDVAVFVRDAADRSGRSRASCPMSPTLISSMECLHKPDCPSPMDYAGRSAASTELACGDRAGWHRPAVSDRFALQAWCDGRIALSPKLRMRTRDRTRRIVHLAYYAMFHAARAVLLRADGIGSEEACQCHWAIRRSWCGTGEALKQAATI